MAFFFPGYVQPKREIKNLNCFEEIAKTNCFLKISIASIQPNLREIVRFLYMVQVCSQKYRRMFKTFYFHI
jgi:hypothetical protein